MKVHFNMQWRRERGRGKENRNSLRHFSFKPTHCTQVIFLLCSISRQNSIENVVTWCRKMNLSYIFKDRREGKRLSLPISVSSQTYRHEKKEEEQMVFSPFHEFFLISSWSYIEVVVSLASSSLLEADKKETVLFTIGQREDSAFFLQL